jgi:hypothetical protein
MTNG